MHSTVKKLEVTYNPINERNTFTNGDCITGQVTLETEKDCQVEYLFVKFKGKAKVLWSERHGQTTMVYYAKDKFFTIKQYFIRNKEVREEQHVQVINMSPESYSSVLRPGIHIYPFTFQVPFQDIPSTFKGADGKIVYTLETELSRSMRPNKKESTSINFVSKSDINQNPGLMRPQHGSKDKKMKLFTSGSVAMDVNIEKSGFFQGEGIKVESFITNNSSRAIKPKYCIYRKHSFFAEGKRRVHTKDLKKEVGAPIPQDASETVTHVINVPEDVEPSILNCNIIKAEHRLRVYLDVKYASDPEIKFEIVILPASQAPADDPPPYAAATASASGIGFESFGNPGPRLWNFEPSQPAGTPSFASLPPPYSTHELYPPLKDFYEK